MFHLPAPEATTDQVIYFILIFVWYKNIFLLWLRQIAWRESRSFSDIFTVNINPSTLLQVNQCYIVIYFQIQADSNCLSSLSHSV